jgi:sugar lactone lactonase YvrE
LNPQSQVSFVSPSDLPDYKPPFFANSVRADASGNIWVRTIPTRQMPGGPVYDVINREGKLVDRVQVPEGRTIVGFGADGSVYLVTRDTTGTTPTMTLERARLR